MYPMMLYFPNEEEIVSLERAYGPWFLIGLIQPMAQVFSIAV